MIYSYDNIICINDSVTYADDSVPETTLIIMMIVIFDLLKSVVWTLFVLNSH